MCGTQGSFGEREGMFGKVDWRLDSPCRLPSLTRVPMNPRQSGEEQSFSSPYCTCFYHEETLPVDCKLATASCLFPKLAQNSGWKLDLESGRILIGPVSLAILNTKVLLEHYRQTTAYNLTVISVPVCKAFLFTFSFFPRIPLLPKKEC